MNRIDRLPYEGARFQTTRWSVILRAGDGASDDCREALNQLIEAYWYPLYVFCRRSGNRDHDARDLTQGFFTDLLGRHGLTTVSPEKGRFRSFLLASFKNFMSNVHRSQTSIRRGGDVTLVPLEMKGFDAKYEREPFVAETPEWLFHRTWVEALLTQVKKRLANDYDQAGKQRLFELLEPHLARGAGELPRAEIAKQLNMSAAAVAMSIYRMRRRYGELLREEVAATVEDPADVEDELRELLDIFARKRRL